MNLNSLLSGICGIMGTLCIIGAAMLYAMGKINDTQGGRGEGMLIGLVCAAAACFAGAAFASTACLNISIGS